MATYLVTYDLNNEVKRPPIVEKIRTFAYAKLSESSYAISTNFTVQEVFAAFKPLLDVDDNLYVVSLKRPYTGFGPKEVNDWLEKNLPY